MTLLDIKGRPTKRNVTPYLIHWYGKSRSQIQYETKQFLMPFWKGHIVYEEFPVYGTDLKVDILNATLRVAIEVNGPQHEKFNKFFHNKNPHNYLKGIKNDFKKLEWLELNKFQLVEIKFNEVKLLSRDFFKEKFNLTL